MAKYKLQEMSNLNGVGEKRVFPKLVANRQLDTKEFVEKLHSYNRAVPESIVSAVIADLGTCLGEMLAMGYTVKLDDIGTFSLSLDFDDNKPVEMTGDDDKMLYRKVTVKDVNYKSSPELIKLLKRKTVLERDMGGGAVCVRTNTRLKSVLGEQWNGWTGTDSSPCKSMPI